MSDVNVFHWTIEALTTPPLLFSSYWRRVNSSVRGTVHRSDGFVYDFDEAFSKARLKNFASVEPSSASSANSLMGGAEYRTWLEAWGTADGPSITKLSDGQREISWSGAPLDYSVSVPVHPWDQQERVTLHYTHIAFVARYRPVPPSERREAIERLTRPVRSVFGQSLTRGRGTATDQENAWENFNALGRDLDVLRKVGVLLAQHPGVEVASLLAELRRGRSLSELRAYFDAGVESIRDVRAVDATLGLDGYSKYSSAGFTKLRDVEMFIERGMDADEARTWGPLGADIKPEHIARYIENGISPSAVRGYLSVGIEQSKDIIGFASDGIAPEFAAAIYETPDARRARLRAERSAASGQTS